MKRFMTTVLALCFFVASVFSPSVFAAESTTEAETTSPAVTESAGNESGDSNPIGDNSSYYNIGELSDQPDIVAESATLIDATTGAVLYQKKADSKRYPASITKVMTALLTIENCKMDDIVTFSDSAVNGVEAGSSSAGIPVGAKLTVEETLYAMMLVSANEAGAALAEQVSGSVGDFAELMTERARELGCTKTNFTNPHGLPDENHLTSAHDMALILKKAMEYEEFRKIAGTINYTISAREGISEPIELWNHAKILRKSSDYYYQYAEGAKTGFTQAALNTLVSYAKKGNVELIAVVLKDHGAENSYKDSIKLYEWGFKKVKGITPIKEFNLNDALKNCEEIDDEQLKSIETLDCTFNRDYYILTKDSIDTANLSSSFELAEDKNTGQLGNILINYDGELIGKTPVAYDITTDAGVNYTSGKAADAPDGKDSTSSSKSALLKSIKAILVFLGCAIILMLVIAVIMINYMKSVKKKRKKQMMAKKMQQQNAQARSHTAGQGRPSSARPRSRSGHSSSSTPRTPSPSVGPDGQPRTRRRRSERNH